MVSVAALAIADGKGEPVPEEGHKGVLVDVGIQVFAALSGSGPPAARSRLGNVRNASKNGVCVIAVSLSKCRRYKAV
jgi:hypothetical protein